MKRMIALAFVIGLAFSVAAQAGVVLIVSDDTYAHTRSGTGVESDFASYLTGLGHTVHTSAPEQYRSGNEGAAGAAQFVADNMVDLVIVSRVTNSGDYNQTAWNDIDAPLLLMGPHLSRSSRWKWLETTNVTQTAVETLNILAPGDPFVSGLGDAYSTSDATVSYNGIADGGNGTVIATAGDGSIMLAKWDAGTEFYDGSGQSAAAMRVLLGGIPYHETHNDVEQTFDHFTENGKAIIGQVVNTMIPEPATIALLGFGGLSLLRKKR